MNNVRILWLWHRDWDISQSKHYGFTCGPNTSFQKRQHNTGQYVQATIVTTTCCYVACCSIIIFILWLWHRDWDISPDCVVGRFVSSLSNMYQDWVYPGRLCFICCTRTIWLWLLCVGSNLIPQLWRDALERCLYAPVFSALTIASGDMLDVPGRGKS